MTYDRPNQIQLSKRVHWALRTVSVGLRGDSPMTPDLTADGIADKLLTDAIETKWPGLFLGFKEREAVDAEFQRRVADFAAASRHGAIDGARDAQIVAAQKGTE